MLSIGSMITRNFTIIVPLFIAALLLAVVNYIHNNPHIVNNITATVMEKCPANGAGGVCAALSVVIKPFYDFTYDLKRKKFSKQELPLIKIYLSDGAINKLNNKRKSTLAENIPILLSEEGDWVNAKILADNGGGLKKVDVQLRLKGDWTDHLENTSKLSFRIKVKNDDYVFGINKFSIQGPNTRNYHTELLLLEMMRSFGIVAPRYYFVDVEVNEYKIGIMALEEHFSKELLESQNRREGPILAIDEDQLWQQRFLNRNRTQHDLSAMGIDLNSNNYEMVDYPVKEFRQPGIKKGNIRTNNTFRGQSLLRDFVEGNKAADEVFDLDLMSRWWILTNMWNASHANGFYNRRYYFNPVTSLLEPIPFDNFSSPNEYQFIIGENIKAAINTKIFQNHLLSNAEYILKAFGSKEYRDDFYRNQEKQLKILAVDRPEGAKVNLSTKVSFPGLLKNMDYFLGDVLDNINDARVRGDALNATTWDIKYSRILDLETPLHMHMRSYVVRDITNNVNYLELKNITNKDIQVRGLYWSKGKDSGVVSRGIVLNKYNASHPTGHLQRIALPDDYASLNKQYSVEYEYAGKILKSIIKLQFRNHDNGYNNGFFRDISRYDSIVIDADTREVVFNKGLYSFDKSYKLPAGWGLILKPGVNIMLENGALLRLDGPLTIAGSADDPVVIDIKSNASFRTMGSWGGISVINSHNNSVISHVLIRGQGVSGLMTRQDYYGMTGCLTFYGGNVSIINARFVSLQCEDSLNIVSADFVMKSVEITDSRADSFDSDFSSGEIVDLFINNSGNDGLDISGSNVNIINSRFIGIGDKAISVGEKSTLTGTGLAITQASTGVASKDLSNAVINDSFFDAVSGSGLITYIKKSEYGPASITCTHCSFTSVTYPTTNQAGSEITIDGQAVNITEFSRSQLVEAGYFGE